MTELAVAVIFWLGHSCFVIQTGDVTILTDPFNAKVGYEVPVVEGIDIVTISHEHGDHTNVAMAAEKPLVLRGLAPGGEQFNKVDQQVRNVRIRTVQSYHDEAQGANRGRNAIFVFDILSTTPPVRLVHMGDFGERRLDPERIKAIGPVDVLFVPVGGFYTIGPAEAGQLMTDLQARIVVPMHWKTAKVAASSPIQGIEPFLKGKKNILRDAPVSGNRLVVTGGLLRRSREAGEAVIVPLAFGRPPGPTRQDR